MTWNTTNTVAIDKVKQMGPVPALDAVLRDGDWVWILRSWAYDYGEGGDDMPYRATNFLTELVNLREMSELNPTYIAVGSDMEVGFSSELVAEADQQAEGFGPRPEQELRDELYAEAYTRLKAYYDVFAADIAEAQTRDGAAVSAPVRQTLTHDRIDRAVVDGYNDSILKGLEKGAYCAYEQSLDVVFLKPVGLESIAPGYRAWIADAESYSQGFVQMVSKGRGLDPGEIKVTGSRDPDEFKTAIRRVTKKKVTFA